MSWGAVAGAAVGLVGASMSSDAAGDAAAGQGAASRESNALQRYMYDRNNELAAPALNAGNLSRDRLLMLLGLSGEGTSANSGSNAPATYEQLRTQLLPQYTRAQSAAGTPGTPAIGTVTGAPANGAALPAGARTPGYVQGATPEQIANMPLFQQDIYNSTPAGESPLGAAQVYQGAGEGPGYYVTNQSTGQRDWVSTAPGNQASLSEIDESGLDSAIRARLAEQEAAAAAREQAARADPAFGSLSQQFQFNTYTPDKYTAATPYDAPDPYVANTFSYTGEDLYNDPSYQFRLNQGNKALERQGAAAGRLLSGGQLQAASNYNQDAASQEFQNAYARAAGTFNTNEGNRFNAYNTNTTNGLNEYNVNEANRFNAFNVNETNQSNAFNNNEANRFNAYQANFTNTINPLLSLSGAGQVAGQQLQANNNNYAQAVSANLQSNANAQGAAGIAQANAFNGALSNGVNAYQQNSLLDRYYANRNGNTASTPINFGSFNSNPASATPAYGSNNFWYNGTAGLGD